MKHEFYPPFHPTKDHFAEIEIDGNLHYFDVKVNSCEIGIQDQSRNPNKSDMQPFIGAVDFIAREIDEDGEPFGVYISGFPHIENWVIPQIEKCLKEQS